MWNSKVKGGYILVEVLVSLSLFAILFSAALSIKLYELKLEKWNSETRKKLAYMDALRLEMVDGFSYNEVLNLKNQGRIYIHQGDMKFDTLEKGAAYSIFTDEEPDTENYASLNIQGDEVLEVTINLHSSVMGMESDYAAKFYKGNYKR